MINLLRNREVRAYLIILAMLSILCAAACAFVGGAACSLIVLVAGACVLGCAIFFTKNRYSELAHLSDCLSLIAAGTYDMDLREYKEGELSVLYDQLHKVTRTLSHQAQTLQKDKMWLADTMADISHQLKTPLTSVAMLADLLDTPKLPEEKRVEFLNGIHIGIERIRWLVLSLLKLSRMDAGAVVFHKEQAPISALVSQALAPLQIAMELKSQTLEQNLNDLVITGDISWLAEAVGNLLKNAMENAPEGGLIRITCQDNPLYTLLEIYDNGPGISKEDLPRIFERFYRGKNTCDGSCGIGLALSKSIINRHGGSLEAYSLPEGGACFSIRLYKATV